MYSAASSPDRDDQTVTNRGNWHQLYGRSQQLDIETSGLDNHSDSAPAAGLRPQSFDGNDT